MSASLSTSGPVPIPFITADPRNPSKFIIDPTAAHLLSSIKGRICPVVVAGPYRSGKSTLLNLLLPPTPSTRRGFTVGSTVQACTKGVWLWGEPIHVKEANKTLLFLDSEGLGSIGSSATFDVQLFSLAVLLSSLFVLNTQGAISESALEQLELVVQMTERVRVTDSRGSPSSTASSSKRHPPSTPSPASDVDLTALAAYFPDFLWVLRDFALQLEDPSGSPITARQYLDQALQPVQGPRSAEKNRTRRVLSTVFAHRDCVPLVRPVADEKSLQRLSQLSERELRPEFVAQMTRLRARVYEQAREKTVEGVAVNGQAYLALAQSYLTAMNGGGIPVIHTAWASVVELQGRRGVDEAMKAFHQHLKSATAALLTTADFDRLVAKARADAVQVLRDVAIGDAAAVAELTAALEGRMEEVVGRERELNASKGREHNAAVWAAAWNKVGGDHVVEAADWAQWPGLEQRLTAEYEAKAAGEGMDDVHRRLLGEKKDRLMARIAARRAEEQKEAERVKKEKEALEKKAAEADKEAARLRLEASYTQKEVDRLQAERKRAEVEKKAAVEERRRVEEQLRAEVRELQEQQASSKRQRKDAEAEMDDMRGKLKKADADVRRLTAQVEQLVKERQLSEREEAQRQSREAEENETKIRALMRQVEDERRLKARAEQLLAIDGEELKKRTTELKALRDSSTSADDRLTRVQGELNQALKDAAFYKDRCQLETKEEETRTREAAALKRKNRELEEQVSKLDEERQQLRTLANEHSREYAAMEDRVQQLVRTKRELEQVRAERDQLTTEMQQLTIQPQKPHPSAASPSASEAPKKRKREEAEVKAEPSLQWEAEDAFADGPQFAPPVRPSTGPRPSALTGRPSLAPRARLSEGEEATDPAPLTIQELKSWLTEMDVELPPKPQPKQFYLDLLYMQVPELSERFPRAQAAASKGKKKK